MIRYGRLLQTLINAISWLSPPKCPVSPPGSVGAFACFAVRCVGVHRTPTPRGTSLSRLFPSNAVAATHSFGVQGYSDSSNFSWKAANQALPDGRARPRRATVPDVELSKWLPSGESIADGIKSFSPATEQHFFKPFCSHLQIAKELIRMISQDFLLKLNL